MSKLFTFLLCILCTQMLYGQSTESEKSTIVYDGVGSYWMVERSNLRRYDNGKYTGLTQREVHSFVYPIDDSYESQASDTVLPISSLEDSNGTLFEGSFSVDEKTLSDMRETAVGIDGFVSAKFYIAATGIVTPIIDNGFPTFRSFPAFPKEAVAMGDRWKGEAVRSVDPLGKGVYTKIPMLVQYTFIGKEVYKGKDVYHIRAEWITDYGRNYSDYKGDPYLESATGRHSADIMVLQDTGAVFLITDRVDETFVYTDGNSVQFMGTMLLFTDFPPSVETDILLPALEKIVPAKNNMVIEQTPAGLRLSVRDIHFLPDSSEFADETERLDIIATALKAAPNAKFLIEGHTASVGKPAGEIQLSLERAQRTAEELVTRGIGRDRFICKGLGSERPIASNDTEEGRSANRRVEITILE